MSLNDDIVIQPYIVSMDTENVVSLLVLVGLLTFFYFAFGRLYEAGGKRDDHRMSYGSSTAA